MPWANGSSPDQLTVVLEDLARIVPYFGLPVARVLERELSRLPFGAAVLLVSALDSLDTAAALEDVRRRGHAVLRCDPRESGGDAPWLPAGREEALAWAGS